MLLSAIDPALLFYKPEDWQSRKSHCFDRFVALVLHFRVTREYGQEIAVSRDLEGLIYKFFPWNADFRNIGELRDLRTFILNDMQRVEHIDTREARDVGIRPAGILCKYVEAQEIIDAWGKLLCGCVYRTDAGTRLQIGTWETPTVQRCNSVNLMVCSSEVEKDAQYNIPLVWDDDSWAVQLVREDWWPDLQRCVELEFKTNAGIKQYNKAREQPFPFKCSKTFMDSLNRFCNTRDLQRSLVEAVTKRVYGILNAGLGDEQIGNIRRFRVTDFWRVHYRIEDGHIVLLEFGPHDMGGLD